MVERDVLLSLEWVIREDHRFSVIYGCWILSNITARTPDFLEVRFEYVNLIHEVACYFSCMW
jgi:hypothetical protein